MRKSIILILGLICLLIWGTASQSIASNYQQVSRSDLRNLELRIRTLEGEVRRLQGSSSVSRSPSVQPNSNTQIVEGELIGRSDPLMERFANLLIDLKEQVKTLDQRITQLENKKKL